MFKTYRYQNFLSLMSFTRLSVWKKKEVLSPQAWGCTVSYSQKDKASSIVPTSVGVYRQFYEMIVVTENCPHKRGGVPR